MSADDCERKMVDCPYCGKEFNVPTVERQLASAEQREAMLIEALVAISSWDMLNPPRTDMCGDLKWLDWRVKEALASWRRMKG